MLELVKHFRRERVLRWFAEQERHQSDTTPRIHAIDDSDSTIYVCVVGGRVVMAAHWPHPLRAQFPDALDGGTLGGEHGGCLAGAPEAEVLEAVEPWLKPLPLDPQPATL